jgi:cell division septum initiation protein DivIVA
MTSFFFNKKDQMKDLQKKLKEEQNKNKELEEHIKGLEEELDEYDEDLNEYEQKYNELQEKFNNCGFNSIKIKDLKKWEIQKCDIQRNIKQNHLKNLKKLIEENPKFITPLYFIKHKGKYQVIDGQHRLKIIQESTILNQDLDIPIRIFRLEKYEDRKNLFLTINNHLPLKAFDFARARSEEEEVRIIECTINNLKLKFKEFIRDARTRKPRISIENLKNQLYNILKCRPFIKNNRDLEEIINDINNTKHNYFKDKDDDFKIGLKPLRKIKSKKPFYLGLYDDWVELVCH